MNCSPVDEGQHLILRFPGVAKRIVALTARLSLWCIVTKGLGKDLSGHWCFSCLQRRAVQQDA